MEEANEHSTAWWDDYFQKEADRFNARKYGDLNNEGVINLAEAILTEIRIEMKHVVAAYRVNPNNKEVKNAVKNMDDLLGSDYFNILTMGHGAAVHDIFRRDCDLSA